MATFQHASTRLEDSMSSAITDTHSSCNAMSSSGSITTTSSSTYKLMASPGSIHTTSDARRRSMVVDMRLCCFDSYIPSFDHRSVSVLEDADDTLLQMVYLDEQSCDLNVSIALRHEAWVDHHTPPEDAESTSNATTDEGDDDDDDYEDEDDSGSDTEESSDVEMMDVSE